MSARPLMPASGELEDGEHRFPVRVYFEDTDLTGVVYHANYLRYMERARSDLLRLLDIDQRAAKESGEGHYAVIDIEGTRERLATAMGSDRRQRDRQARRPAQHPRHRRRGRAVRRAVRHGLGHHAQLHRHRRAQNTSLAVVAPGIAEALFATAIGLFAAIPAVIAYNRFSHGVNRIEARLNRFADGFHATLSRSSRWRPESDGDALPSSGAAAGGRRWPRSTSRRWST
jgi:hypothetical protein